MRIRIDRGATFLALCECGWRGLPTGDHAAALQMARHHELRAHPGQLQAARMLDNHRRRNL